MFNSAITQVISSKCFLEMSEHVVCPKIGTVVCSKIGTAVWRSVNFRVCHSYRKNK